MEIIIKAIEPNTTFTISKNTPPTLKILSEVAKMQIRSNILAETELEPGTYIINESQLTHKNTFQNLLKEKK